MKKAVFVAVLIVAASLFYALQCLHYNKPVLKNPIKSGLHKQQGEEQALRNDASKMKVSDETSFSRKKQKQWETNMDIQVVSIPPDDTHFERVSPSQKLETQDTDSSFEDERNRYIRIAFVRAKEIMEIHDPSTATIEYEKNVAVVTFPLPPHKSKDGRPPYPGPDYLARVKIDRNTGKVVELLGAQ